MGMILKLKEDKYIDWSLTVDAPVTSIMTKKECESYVLEIAKRDQKIHSDMDPKLLALKMQVAEEEAKQRMERVEQSGTSSRIPGDTMESTVAGNRAGPKETNITLDEIVELYTYTADKKGKFPFS